MSFKSLGLSQPLVDAVTELHYAKPYPIQQEAIPAVVSVGLNLLLIPPFGFVGASIVSVLTEALVWVIQLNFSRRFIKDVSILPAMSKIILASVVMYLGLVVFKMFVQLKPMLNVAVDGLVGAIIYIVLIIVLRVVDMKDLKQQLMKN